MHFSVINFKRTHSWYLKEYVCTIRKHTLEIRVLENIRWKSCLSDLFCEEDKLITFGKPRNVLASQISNAATAFVTSAFGLQGVA